MASWTLPSWRGIWGRIRRPSVVNGRESSGTRSKVSVTPETALQVTSILCAARVIAEGVAQVPLKLYDEKNDPNGRTVRSPARDHALYKLIAYQPNDWMTSFEFRETLTLHAVLAGNAYAFINRRDSDGEVRELIPIAPDDIKVIVEEDRSVRYEINLGGGQFTKVEREKIFHLKGPSWDGAIGLNIVSLAREAIGLATALEQSQADLFGKGARPSGVLATETPVGDEAVQKMRVRWNERFGPGGDGGVAMLDGNWKFTSLNMTGVDAQQLETRRFQIEEGCRAVRVFPQMVMQSDKASTFASAGAFFQAHVIHSIAPWTERWEGALKRDVVRWETKDVDVWPRFILDGLMEGDPDKRSAFYAKMVNMGAMSPDEVREAENRNPRDGGDEFLSPLNMRLGAGDAPKETNNAGA
ncbi:phage portal protein [Brevundimonas sp. S30B]|uniref:phage portal protein n=1 Tax=unclassified Brevundimonas TaxID=2622653 RepID=UPI001071DD26|nr:MULTISPECIES: phage portal protein [unclassified Brevundimonas]QBX37229.1 phage portal protein [Brevundimonas sp. MF30-B]TFW03977.1 phage portal protein [Brevundimonas sp. S30B]